MKSSRAVRFGAALEANDVEPGFGQFARENAAGETDADADRIDFLEHRGHVSLHRIARSADRIE